MAWLFERKITGRNYTNLELEDYNPTFSKEYADFLAGKGLNLPPTELSVARQVKQASGGLPDIVAIAIYNFCNQRFKNFVESWEPGLHIFHPVKFLRANGDFIAEYYAWTVGQDVDCLFTGNLAEFWREDRFDLVRARTFANLYYRRPQRDPTVIQVSRPAIAGRHLWTAGLLGAVAQGAVSYFMSEEMYRDYRRKSFLAWSSARRCRKSTGFG
jgi:hypothetical protein